MRTRIASLLIVAACNSPATPSADDEGDIASNASEAEAEAEAGSDVEATGEDEGCLFSICDLDILDACGQPCDIWAPNYCPIGHKCAAVACEVGYLYWDSTVCVPVMGDQRLGDSCTDFGNRYDGLDDCADGLLCWDADPTTELGSCHAYCGGSPLSPSCPGSTTCIQSGDGVLPLCPAACDPLTQDCKESSTCLPSQAKVYECALDASGDGGQYGSPCEFANACAPGLVCGDPDDVPEPSCDGAIGCCTPYCDLSLPNMCPGAGQVCEPVFDPQPAGYENVGVCRVPSP